MAEQVTIPNAALDMPAPTEAQLGWEEIAANYKDWHPGLHSYVEDNLERGGYGHLIKDSTSPAQLDMPAPQVPPTSDETGDESRWGYTSLARETVELRQQAERQAGKSERPTIGRDSPLFGGVYEGAYGGEAIVVDYETEPKLIDAATERVIAAATNASTGQIDKNEILDGVFSVVSNSMRYDSKAVDSIFQNILKGQNGKKISLNVYIEQGVGECRHQALYAGAILENLHNRGHVGGRASVDRNMVRNGADGKYDGHAWVRYTNSANEVFILDIAQQKIGTLAELMAAHDKDPAHTWDYARQEDSQANKASKQHVPQTSQYDIAAYTNRDGIIDRLPWETEGVDDITDNVGLPVESTQDQRSDLEQQFRELNQKLSVNDSSNMRLYVEAMMSKRDSQKADDGPGSIYWGQLAGQHFRDISENGKTLLGQYEALYRSL